MLFMNEFEINEALERYQRHEVLSTATKFLAEFRDQVDQHSDGWPYWRLPVQAAKALMTLILHPETATLDALSKAIGPIRAFYTRKGYAMGMKFPTIDLGHIPHRDGDACSTCDQAKPLKAGRR